MSLPAPSLIQLYDFETQFDNALTAWLTALLGQSCPVMTAFEPEKLKVPSCQALFTLGPYYTAASQLGSGHPSTATVPAMVDYWTASIKIVTFGRRVADKSPEPYTAIIRANLEKRSATTPDLNTYLQWVQIIALDHQTSQRRIGDDKTDVSDTTYQIIFGVLGAAYPTP